MTAQMVLHHGFEGGYLPAGFDDTGPVSVAIASDQANSGTYALKVELGSNDQYNSLDPESFGITRQTVATPFGMGIAFRVSNLSAIENCVPIVISSNGDGSGDALVGARFDRSGIVRLMGASNFSQIQNETGGTTLWTSNVPIIQEGQWYYFEIAAKFDATTGTVDFHINGIEQYSATGLDTNYLVTGSLTVDTSWGTYWDTLTSTSTDLWIDDLYVAEDLGILGPQVHEMLSPTSTVENDGTGSDGNSVDNHLLVDNIPFAGADYVDLDVALDREVYGLTNTANTGTISALSVHAQVHNPDTGSVTSNALIISNVTEADGPGVILTDTAGDKVVYGPIENDPDTAVAWTTGGVDALTAGIEVSAIV